MMKSLTKMIEILEKVLLIFSPHITTISSEIVEIEFDS